MKKDLRPKIAILYMCTGEYSVFWKLFYLSFEKYFLKKSVKHYYIFSDNNELDYLNNGNVHFRNVDKLEWPYSTLLKFHALLEIEREIRRYDYCFFFNANMMCMQNITEEEFLPIDNNLLVVEHPGHFFKNLRDWKWERNVDSRAYIECGKEKVYVCGGINGGKANAYMNMAIELRKRIDEDLQNNIISVVHDESHINKYILDFPDYRLLDSAYAYPEGWNIPVKQKMVLFDKSRIFNVYRIKNDNNIFKSNEYCMIKKSRDRLGQYFEVSRQWLYCKNRGINFENYFLGRGIKSIAIYGYKNLGQVLLDELRGTAIDIKYFIDNKVETAKENIPVINGTDVYNFLRVDGIIITALYDFYSIYKELVDKIDYPMYSLESLVHDMYMSCYE